MRHVALDAEPFVREAFNFSEDSSLARLGRAAREGHVAIHITDITLSELRNHVRRAQDDAATSLKQFRSKARLLLHAQDPLIELATRDYSFDPARESVLAKLNAFLDDSRVNIVSSDEVRFTDLLVDYHAGNPPFGRAGKKSEFPDAVTLRALEIFAENLGEPIAVVSNDGDVEEFAKGSDRLQHFSALSGFLAELLEASTPGVPALVAQVLAVKSIEIAEAIKNDFPALGFVLTDQWGDVLDVRVKDVSILDHDEVEVAGDTVHSVVSLGVRFSASVEYDDHSTATYDHEEKRYFFHRSISTDVEDEQVISADVEILLDRASPADSHVQSVQLRDRDIYVSADEWY